MSTLPWSTSWGLRIRSAAVSTSRSSRVSWPCLAALPRAMTGVSRAPGAASLAALMAAANSRSLTPCLIGLAATASCNCARVRGLPPQSAVIWALALI
ncbi:hypothetical protein D3C75_977630 [compost metagenome]